MSGEQYRGNQYQGNRRDNGGQYQAGDTGGPFDVNEAKVSGTVERFNIVDTRTGTPMIRFALRCWRERFQIVAFKDLASETTLRPGERVKVAGRIQCTQWQDKDTGQTRHGFQIIARTIAPDGEQLNNPPRPGKSNAQRPHHRPAGGVFGLRGDGPDADGRQQRLPGTTGGTWSRNRPGVMDYQGGPF